jgi:conjugative transposon TraM protein
MEQDKNKELKKRKMQFFIIAPLVVIAFLGLIFWGLGGGNNASQGTKQAANRFNITLPQAKLKDKEWNQLKFYEQAKNDSLKRAALVKDDPYYQQWLTVDEHIKDSLSFSSRNSSRQSNRLLIARDTNEEKIDNKIAQINAQLSRHEPVDLTPKSEPRDRTLAISTPAVDRLEKMMETMKSSEPDPEMEQLSEVIDKLGALQQPTAFAKWQQASESQPEKIFAISYPKAIPVTTLGATNKNDDSGVANNGFYSIDEPETTANIKGAVRAMVYGTQIIGDKSYIILRLLAEVFVGGVLIPEGYEVVGQVALSAHSIDIIVKQIVFNQQVFPVTLVAYSLNGVKGLPAAANMAGEFARQTTDRAVQGITFNPSLSSIGGEAINAGLQAAKSIISKMTKPLLITVPTGTQILLADERKE